MEKTPEWLGRLETMTLKDGDILVVQVPEDTTAKQIEQTREFITEHFKRHTINAGCLIVYEPANIGIIRGGNAE